MNGTLTSAGDFLLSSIPPSQLPISADLTGTKFYTLSVSVVSGSITLAAGTGNTFAVALFNSNTSSYIRVDTTPTTLDGYLGYKQSGTPSTGNYRLLFQCWREGTIFNNLKFRVQIEIADNRVPTVWHPYENLCPISGRNSVEVEANGVNLFDINSPEHWYINPNNAKVSSGSARSVIVPCNPGDVFTLQVAKKTSGVHYIAYADSNGLILNRLGTSSTNNITLTAPQDAAYCYAGVSFIQHTSGVQLELGSTATEYEPYVGTTHTIFLPETVYGGDIGVVSGDGESKYEMLLYDENTRINLLTNHIFQDYTRCYLSKPNRKTSAAWYMSNAINMYSTIKKPERNEIILYYSGTEINLLVGNNLTGIEYGVDTAVTAREKMLAFFKLQPIQLLYELATPAPISTTPTEISTVEGQNNVFSPDGDVTVILPAERIEYTDPQPLSTAEGDNTVTVVSNVDPVELKVEYLGK